MKTVAYLRVSTDKQDTEKNKADILRFTNGRDLGKVYFVEETVSGTIHWRRRKLGEIVDQLEAGDNLVVPELSRLGRSMLGILEVLEELKKKNINVYDVKGGFQLDGSMQATVLVAVFSMLAQVERDLISARTKEALAAKKKAGVKLGPPRILDGGKRRSKLDKFEPEIMSFLANGSTLTYIARRYNTTPQTLLGWLQRRGIDRRKVAEQGLKMRNLRPDPV